MGIIIFILWTIILIQFIGTIKSGSANIQNLDEFLKDRIIARLFAFLLPYTLFILLAFVYVTTYEIGPAPLSKGGQIAAAFMAFIYFVIFDAVIGGSFSARLKAIGWNQGINSVYQFFYGAGILLILAVLFIVTGSYLILTIDLLLLLFLVEDTMYYVFIFKLGFWKIIYKLTGEKYILPGEEHFPESIAGWPGWIGRLFNVDFEIDLKAVWVLNAIGAVSALIYIWMY